MMAAQQTLLLGRHTERVRAALESLQAQRWLQRFWENDASLWSRDQTVQTAIRQRLGWLTIPRVMRRGLEDLRAATQELQQLGFRRALVLGMGGSGLFAEICRNTFGVAPHHLDLAVLDTTDPTAIQLHQRRGSLRDLLVIVSSKSGTTAEISALSTYFYEVFRSADLDAGAHCLGITDAGSPLDVDAKALKFRRVFTHGPTTGADVGGRFSALTYFGLVPASLLGMDTSQLLERAVEMLERCGSATPLQDHPAAMLGAVLGALAMAGRDKLTLLCAPGLASFGTWVEQIVAESTGKSGKGIVPIEREPLHGPSQYAADRLFIELQLTSEIDRTLDRQVHALMAAGHPVVRIHWHDRYDLGGEVIRWSMATTVAGSLMGLNPFDEPNVQESKDRTKALLAQYARDGRFPEMTPVWSGDGLALYGTMPEAPRSMTQAFASFFHQGRAGDYVAVLSFLPRTDALDQAVRGVREILAEQVGLATMVGFGPRYLHSTGQLYKGGPDTGLFLQLTAEEPHDVPVPGESFTFGALKQAQALGDFQAMQQKGRRILRVHLRGDLERAMHQVAGAVEDAMGSVVRRSS